MPLTPEEIKLRARLGIQTRLATEDPVAMTAPARSAFLQKHVQQAWESIGPYEEQLVRDYPGLPESSLLRMVETEVLRRAEALRKAHMTRAGLASAKARRKKKGRAAPDRTPAPAEKAE